jgi:hypothetical protein
MRPGASARWQHCQVAEPRTHGGLHHSALHHTTVLRRALTSLRPAYRRTSSVIGPAAAPGLLFGGNGSSSRWCRSVGEPAAESLRRVLLAASVVLGEHHRGDRSLALPPDVVDDPERAVLRSAVAGEEPPIAAARGFIVGGPVVLTEVAPVACGMAIEQGVNRQTKNSSAPAVRGSFRELENCHFRPGKHSRIAEIRAASKAATRRHGCPVSTT